MARQRRDLEDQLADILTMARGARTNTMTTPAMAAVGPDMIQDEAVTEAAISRGAVTGIHIQDNAILNQHLGENAVALENLDATLKGTLADLASNEIVLEEAKARLDAAESRLDDAFETITVLPSQLEQLEIDARAAATDMSKVFFQSSKPQVRVGSEKDLWINTGDGNSPYRYDLTKKDWVKATDTAALEMAKTQANDLVLATKAQILTAQDIAVEAARVNAIAAAAADAKAKTEAAEARVATAAAAQAQSMADAAQAAAVAAAKVYADAQASGAGGLALEAAKADATAKADAAKNAAIAAAALDATAKKEQAEATAAADAKKKADAALASAKTDSTTKANAAVDLAVSATPRGVNVVVNGGFEHGFTGWELENSASTSAFSIDETVSRSGSKSFTTTHNGGFRQKGISVTPGQVWEFSLHYKTDEAYSRSNAGGLRLQALVNGVWADVASSTLAQSLDVWSRSTVRYTIPAGVTEIRARFAFNYQGGARIWVDDIALEDITAQLTAAAATTAALETAKADATAKANQARSEALAAAAAADRAARAAAGLAGTMGRTWFQADPPPTGAVYSWEGKADASASIKTVDGVLARKNLFNNAGMRNATDLTGWAGSNNTHTYSWGEDRWCEGHRVRRMTWDTVSGTGTTGDMAVVVKSIATLLGEDALFTVAFKIRVGRAGMKVSSPSIYSAGTSTIKTHAASPAVSDMVPGVTYRVWATVSATAASAKDTRVRVGISSPRAGDFIEMADVVAYPGERVEALDEWFWGESKDDRTGDLWIDTDAGNTPKRWDTTQDDWVAVTDQAAIDAAVTAAAADATAKTTKALEDAKAHAVATADAAQAAAVTAAAADAKAQAEAAEARAAVTAAADAKAKADAAQAAALAAAKTYAEAEASDAGADALAKAKADATTKANAAQVAAITAAATDATAKKEQAEATAAADAKAKADAALVAAKADAKSKADAALAAAKTDATTKADAAKNAAIAAADIAAKATAKSEAEAAEARAAVTAAADAKAKADAAQAAALAAAKTYADAEASGAGAAALDAAKADATEKADAAQAAAISAAALDATAKKEAAEATAAADAKTKADKALSDAKADATSKANAAKAAAITAAAADAQTKADKAQAAAITAADIAAKATAKSEAEAAEARAAATAAADAKSKADAAQAAALAAAKTYADAQAAGAGSDALAAAKADATEKADNAEAAAIAAAALDATAKKEAAEATAAADAKTKADKALADAKADATTKANNAKNAAITAAAADATTKANAAQAAAVAAADVAAKATAKSEAEAAEARVAIAAAADAKSKADAAQAAALAAAKTYTDAEASGAGTAALNAAKADATSKANAAKQAAIDAAALDATAKKEQAEATAAADAKTKADKALVDAKADAKTKADAALAAAKADATTKADNALVQAEAFTVTKMNEVANSKNATFYSTSAPSNTANPGTRAGDTWRRKNSSGHIIGEWEWSGTAWTQRKMTSASMTAIDVGVLTAGSTKIIDAVAQSIAAGTADIQKANIANLTVTETTNLNEAVAKRIASNTGEFIELYTDQLRAKEGNLDTAVVNHLYGQVVESRLMRASQMEIGGVNNYASVTPVVDLWDYSTAHSSVVNVAYANSTQGRALRFQSAAGITSIYSKKFVVTPGESLSVEATFRNDGGLDVVGQMTLGLQYQDAAGATLAWDIYAVASSNKHTHATREYKKGISQVPAGAAYARVLASTRAIADATMVNTAVYGYIIDPIVRTNVNAELLVDGTVKARHMAIVGDNLIADSKFLNPAMNEERISSSTFAADTVSFVKDDVSTSNVFRLTEHATTNRSLNLMGTQFNAQIPVRKGDVLKFEVHYRCRGNAVADVTDKSQIRFAIFQDGHAGAYIRYVGVGNYETVVGAGTGWKIHTSEFVITQDDVGFIRPQVQLRNPAYSGEMEFKWPSMVNASTSGKLESNLVLATKITAGDPNGTRAEMSPDGFKVFGKASGDTTSENTYEIVRLGVADTNDMFAIADKDGITQASISETGIVSGKQVYASEDIIFQGDSLSEILWRLPKGHVASAYRDTHSAYNAKAGGQWAPYLRLDVYCERNRLYRVSTSPIKFGQDPGGQASIRIVQQTGSIASITAGTNIDTVNIIDGRDGNSVILSDLAQLTGAVQNGPSGDVVLASFLLMYKSNVGQFGIRADGWQPVRLMVEDMGPLVNTFPGVHLETTSTNGVPPTAPPAKSRRTSTWDCNWIKSFQGNGSEYPMGNKGYQGLSPAGYGNLKSVQRFPDMTGTLSGADIHEIKVYLYFEHWYYNAGGTARIGLNGGTAPTTYAGGTPVVTSGGWPKPGGRWVTIPSQYYAGFKSGQYKGITLEGDSTYGTYGIAHPGKIQITYTK